MNNFNNIFDNLLPLRPLFPLVQSVLPTVFDDSLSYLETLGKVVKALNDTESNVNTLEDAVRAFADDLAAFEKLTLYQVNMTFDENTGNYTADKTFADIDAALIEGRTPVLHVLDRDGRNYYSVQLARTGNVFFWTTPLFRENGNSVVFRAFINNSDVAGVSTIPPGDENVKKLYYNENTGAVVIWDGVQTSPITGEDLIINVLSSHNIYPFMQGQGAVTDVFNMYVPLRYDASSNAEAVQFYRVVNNNMEIISIPRNSNIATKTMTPMGAYVTPEMFGAIGNGVTDDTAAIQAAVNSGKNVVFGYGKTYKCDTINVVKNIEIDCQWSEFICTGETLFNCYGTVTGSISGADYVAYMPYALPNDDKYTGLAMLESSDNVFSDREYFYGGFMADFADGVCKERKPIAFTGVTVNKLNPITCAIKNIAGVSFTGTGTALTYGVKIEYGMNCVVSDYCIDGVYYSAVTFKKCKYCKADNIHGFLNWPNTANAYPVEFLDSSNCVLSDSQIYAKPWTCFSIGGNYICYDNRIENSTLIAYGNSNNGVGSHNNAIGTIIENVVSTAIHLGAGGRLTNCKILASVNGEATKGTITLAASTVDGVADFYVDGVDFLFEPNVTPPSTVEIVVGTDAQTTGNDFYIRNVTVKNVKTNAPDKPNYIRFFDFGTPGSDVTSVTVSGILNFENVCGFYGMKVNAESKVVFDALCKMIIRNCNGEITNNKYILGLGANGAITRYPPLVEIENCDLHNIAGTFNKLRFNNVKFDGSIGGYSGDLLIAEGVDYIPIATIQAFTKARIVNMRRTEDQIWAYTNHDSGASYKMRYTSSGLVTETL